MIIGKSNCADASIGLPHKLVEPDSNTEASEYISTHYKELLTKIRKMGIKEEKANDLLHDVYISIIEAESDGQAYDMEYAFKNGKETIMLVEQFVIGRIKLYSKNDKYRTDIVESGNTKVEKIVCIEAPAMNKRGYIYDKNGKLIMEKKYIKEKTVIATSVCAASYDESNDSMETNDSFQKAYAAASTSDSISNITDFYSLKEQIDYCIDIGYLNGVNVLNILKNIDLIAEMLGESSRKKKKADNLFLKLSELVEYHNQFGEALMNIIQYSAKDKANFELILSTY